VKTTRQSEFVEITAPVAEVVRSSDVQDGVCTVYVRHTTAGVTINENADPSVVRDMLAHLERAVPPDGPYTHGEGNSDSHIKTSIMGSSVSIPVTSGRLMLGTWQGIYFCEFDGPRSRSYIVTVVGS